ncbi:MAG: CobW family GTP-binding protein [Alkalilacustris sp.]
MQDPHPGPQRPPADPRIPVTLITGYLGAGKTTVLNRLLATAEAGRVAVIVNEIGQIGLDHDLVSETTEEMVLMQSGCLCCSVRGDLVATLADLGRRRANGQLAFDRVVIETTGLADPAPIQHTLVLDPGVAGQFLLDGVVTVICAATGMRTLDAGFEAVGQVAVADLLLITKADLVPPQALAGLEARLARLNPAARRLRADHGRVAPGALFGLGALRGDVTPEQGHGWAGLAAAPALQPGQVPGLSTNLGISDADRAALPDSLTGLLRPRAAERPPAPPTARHDDRITSLAATLDEPVSSELLGLWLESLVWLNGPNILRFKAIVHTTDDPHPFAVHGVQHIFHPPVPLPHWPSGDRTSRFVLIGRDLDPALLEDSLGFLRTGFGTPDDPDARVVLHTLDRELF